jgi:hypothetical protein
MGGTGYTLRFGILIEDPSHWTPEHHMAAVAANADNYDDWVRSQIEDVMRKAGEAFIAQHPDLFRIPEIV